MNTATTRSFQVFPAGSNGEFNLPEEHSKVITHGKGSRLWTTTGDCMLDFSMGWGSALPGHARPEIVDVVQAQLGRGTNFAYVTEQSLELAEEIIRMSPACEALRFCASGTEATMYCLRLARAFTGKNKVLKFEGAYHGAHDVGVISLFPGKRSEFPQGTSSSAGISSDCEQDVLVAPFNNLPLVREIVDTNVDELAAIIVEPLQRCLPPEPGFLEGLRQIADQSGILLIFDEVVTGFRLAYGGAQEYYGVSPDLVAYGKALGGGLPLGAYGGSREVMRLVEESRLGTEATYVWTASTLGGNPISAAASLAALGIYRQENTYPQLHSLGNYLREQMRDVLNASEIPAVVLGDGPLAQIAFTEEIVRDYRSSQHRDKEFARNLMLKLFESGIFLNPMGTKLYLSLAHTKEDCDELCQKLRESMQAILPTSVLMRN